MSTFVAVQCFSCGMFQNHGKTPKKKKWKCVICNERQSFVKIYARGRAKNIRKVVQSLNADRLCPTEPSWQPKPETGPEFKKPETGPDRDRKLANIPSSWSEYLNSPNSALADNPGSDSDGMNAHTLLAARFGDNFKDTGNDAISTRTFVTQRPTRKRGRRGSSGGALSPSDNHGKRIRVRNSRRDDSRGIFLRKDDARSQLTVSKQSSFLPSPHPGQPIILGARQHTSMISRYHSSRTGRACSTRLVSGAIPVQPPPPQQNEHLRIPQQRAPQTELPSPQQQHRQSPKPQCSVPAKINLQDTDPPEKKSPGFKAFFHQRFGTKESTTSDLMRPFHLHNSPKAKENIVSHTRKDRSSGTESMSRWEMFLSDDDSTSSDGNGHTAAGQPVDDMHR